MATLAVVRQAVARSTPLVLIGDAGPTEDVSTATAVSIDGNTTPLDTTVENGRTLKACLFSWLQRDLGTAEYIELCNARGIANLSFIERNDLVAYLTGKSESLTSSADPASAPAAAAAAKTDADLLRLRAVEHKTHPFSYCLHGRKEVDFSSVQREAREFFLVQKRVAQQQAASAAAVAKDEPKRRLRDPIILLSPSASALVTMHNVKRLLEEGVFVPSDVAAREVQGPPPEVLSLSYKSKLRPGMTLRFVVVESTDKFKPDYWDRLLVVFTTGQSWQFRPYATGYSDPRSLFQKTKGILMRYTDESATQAERDWNIQAIKIDRTRRHMDKVAIGQFWDSIERWIEQRGKQDFYKHERR